MNTDTSRYPAIVRPSTSRELATSRFHTRQSRGWCGNARRVRLSAAMNDRLNSTTLTSRLVRASAACCATKARVDSAVSYCIQASGHSLIVAAVCASATSAPQKTGWRQSTHRSRIRKKRPTAIPPTPYKMRNASDPPMPIAVFADRMLS